jgi:hypothetical protein
MDLEFGQLFFLRDVHCRVTGAIIRKAFQENLISYITKPAVLDVRNASKYVLSMRLVFHLLAS